MAEHVPIADIVTLRDSGVWGKDAETDGISILRSTNFGDDGEISLENLALKSVDKRDSERKRLIPGDILVEKSGGGPKQPVGRVCFFRGDSQPLLFGNFIARLRVDPTRCEPRFLFWFLHIGHQNAEIRRRAEGARASATRRPTRRAGRRQDLVS